MVVSMTGLVLIVLLYFNRGIIIIIITIMIIIIIVHTDFPPSRCTILQPLAPWKWHPLFCSSLTVCYLSAVAE